jgi:hypothetical protein
MNSSSPLMIFIDPPSHHFQRDALFDSNNVKLNRDNVLAPYHHVRERFLKSGVPVHTADFLVRGEKRAQRNIYVSTGILSNYRNLIGKKDVVLSAYFAFECPVAEPKMYRAMYRAQEHFKHIFSWSDSATLERFTGGRLRCEKFFWPQPYNGVHDHLWQRNERKFLTIINSNKLPRLYWQELYTERMKAIEFFSRRNEIDLYGMNWDKAPYRVGRTWMPHTLQRLRNEVRERWQRMHPDPLLTAARRVYCGPVLSKAEVLSQYTFALCFENMILKGWITEKIFDCFYSGTVPVYWGSPDVQEFIPTECFIDMRRFGSYEDLRSHLLSLSPESIQGYRNAAREFVSSSAFHRFSKEAFADIFERIVQEEC